jgi:competence protein ComEC
MTFVGLRRMKFALIVFLLGCLLAGCNQGEKLLTSKLDPSIAVKEMNPQRILIHYIGLDKGEATLIQAQDMTILVDTGAPKSWKALNRFLKDKAVKRIDYLFVTNDDPMWSGNMNQILHNYDVNQLVLPKGMEREIMG